MHSSFLRAAAIAVLIAYAPATLHADAATWLGGTGSYTDPSRWSTGMPNSALTDVFIDGSSAEQSNATLTMTRDTGSFYTKGLHISSDDALSITNRMYPGTFETNGPVTVDGRLALSENVSFSMNGAATIEGTGVVDLVYGRIRSSSDLTVAESLIVRGRFGSVDAAGFRVINRGVMTAEGDFSALAVVASRFENFGTVEVPVGTRFFCTADFDRSANGGTLVHNGTIIIGRKLINDGQVMSLGTDLPGGGGAWMLGNTVAGGIIRGAGGELRVDYDSELLYSRRGGAVLDRVTLDNAVIALDGSLTISNGISGVGTITFRNPEAIEGTGNINIDTVPAGITIRGSVGVRTPNGPEVSKGTIRTTRNLGIIRAEAPRVSVFGPGSLNLVGSTPIVNAGGLEIADGTTLYVFAQPLEYPQPRATTLSFTDGGSLTIDGSGLLAIIGDLDLASLSDVLRVLSKSNATAYDDQLIATYTGNLTGTFDFVTPGIMVDYGSNEIRISGTPVPEPAAALLAGLGYFARRRRKITPAPATANIAVGSGTLV